MPGERGDDGDEYDEDEVDRDRSPGQIAGAEQRDEAPVQRQTEERMPEQLIGMPADRRIDEETVDRHEHGHLRKHRQAPGEGGGVLLLVQLHELLLHEFGLVFVLLLQLTDLWCQTLASDAGPDLRHSDGNEYGTHQDGEDDDGQGGAEAAGEGFENVADPRDDRVGGLDEQTDGQEFVDVHG